MPESKPPESKPPESLLRIAELWRYPVKSMQGERVDTSDITAQGLTGDRHWSIRDAATEKNLTGRREPRLLFAAARVVDGEVVITLPDGTETAEAAVLSTWLEREVELVHAGDTSVGTYEISLDADEADNWVQWQGPEGSFHDSTKTRVSIVTRTAMRDWDPRRFRMNVIVDGDGNENALVGHTIAIGSSAQLEVLKRVDRCVMVTRPQADGVDRDLDVLKTINADHGGDLGIGANVIAPGPIAVGDEVKLVG